MSPPVDHSCRLDLRLHHPSNFSLRSSEESKPLLNTVQIQFRGPQLPLLSNYAFWSLLHICFFHHAMTPTSYRNSLLVLELFVALAGCADLNYGGEAVTTRFWDCCKPSCGWRGKASVSSPVDSCSADNQPISLDAGTGCNGGTAYACSQQQPWAINDTLSYGFAGVYLTQDIVGDATENAWCCACYQLDFTSEPLIGKRMIVQASNTAYDVNTANRFSLAVSHTWSFSKFTLIIAKIPGGNTTSADGCARQYGVAQSVFGQDHAGIATRGDCQKLPQAMISACEWRFDWLQDASYPRYAFLLHALGSTF